MLAFEEDVRGLYDECVCDEVEEVQLLLWELPEQGEVTKILDVHIERHLERC